MEKREGGVTRNLSAKASYLGTHPLLSKGKSELPGMGTHSEFKEHSVPGMLWDPQPQQWLTSSWCERDVCPSLGSFALSNNDVSDAQMIDPHLQHLTRPAHSPSFVCSAPRASLGLTKGAFLPLTFGTFKNTPPTPSHSLFSLQAA